MTRIEKHLKSLEAERRNARVTAELWQEWRNHPMTKVFFLSLDIEHTQHFMRRGDTGGSLYWMGHHMGRAEMLQEIIEYEPHEITDEDINR